MCIKIPCAVPPSWFFFPSLLPIIIIIILSFDIAPFPYKHSQRRITSNIWYTVYSMAIVSATTALSLSCIYVSMHVHIYVCTCVYLRMLDGVRDYIAFRWDSHVGFCQRNLWIKCIIPFLLLWRIGITTAEQISTSDYTYQSKHCAAAAAASVAAFPSVYEVS